MHLYDFVILNIYWSGICLLYVFVVIGQCVHLDK